MIVGYVENMLVEVWDRTQLPRDKIVDAIALFEEIEVVSVARA